MLVSVLTPSRDRCDTFLPRCVASVAGQLGLSFAYEHVVIDDGSADRTWSYLRRLSIADPRVKPLRIKPSAGPAHALNAGLEVATGELIVPLDDDDLLLPQSLRMHAAFMREHPHVDWAFGNAVAIDEHDRVRFWEGEEGFCLRSPRHISVARWSLRRPPSARTSSTTVWRCKTSIA